MIHDKLQKKVREVPPDKSDPPDKRKQFAKEMENIGLVYLCFNY